MAKKKTGLETSEIAPESDESESAPEVDVDEATRIALDGGVRVEHDAERGCTLVRAHDQDVWIADLEIARLGIRLS